MQNTQEQQESAPVDSGSVTEDSRKRTPTEKGHEYQVNLYVQGFTAAQNAFKKLYDYIDGKLSEISEFVILENLLDSLTVKHEKFLDSFKKLESLEFDEKSHLCRVFTEYAERQIDIKEKIESKLLKLQESNVKDKSKVTEGGATALPKDDDNESVCSRHTQVSKVSAHSKGSIKSFLKRLDNDEQAAKITDELKHFEKCERELEQRKQMKLNCRN